MSDLEQLLAKLVDERVRAALAEREHSPDAITVTEYARRWSISKSTVRAAIREGRLEAVHIGRAVRIPADAKIGRRAPRDRTERARLALLRGGRVR
jgi:excisionase family DNA binding protein